MNFLAENIGLPNDSESDIRKSKSTITSPRLSISPDEFSPIQAKQTNSYSVETLVFQQNQLCPKVQLHANEDVRQCGKVANEIP
jgi:hypothetical protein